MMNNWLGRVVLFRDEDRDEDERVMVLESERPRRTPTRPPIPVHVRESTPV